MRKALRRRKYVLMGLAKVGLVGVLVFAVAIGHSAWRQEPGGAGRGCQVAEVWLMKKQPSRREAK